MNLASLALPLLAAVGVLAFRAPDATMASRLDAPLPAGPTERRAPADAQRGAAVHLRGDHGFTYDGTVQGFGSVASTGRIEFDGRGRVSASFSTVVQGTLFRGTFVGAYAVNRDGTGWITIDLPWLGRQAHGDFVVVDNGRGTLFTATDPGYTVTGSTRQM